VCALSHPLVIWYPTVYHNETYFVVLDLLRQPLASKSDKRPVGTLHRWLRALDEEHAGWADSGFAKGAVDEWSEDLLAPVNRQSTLWPRTSFDITWGETPTG
jgi:hypothetical protein